MLYQPRFALFLLLLLSSSVGTAQDSSKPFVRGGIYDRPFLFRPSTDLAIGGYAETMVRSEYEQGIHENISFEARRFNIFLFSRIARGIKLNSELEFEHGTEEIKLEMAIIDIELYEELNVRAGILIVPLGKFNLAHDAPLNRFNDRPLVSTLVIPSTFSEAGMGLWGNFHPFALHRFTYEAYAVNGLNDDILLGGSGTSIPDGRPKSFEEDNNGSPALVGRFAWIAPTTEVGVSAYHGIYNKFRSEGIDIDSKRRITLSALDVEQSLWDITMKGEFAYANIDIPPGLDGLFAKRQYGFYGEAMYKIFERVTKMFPGSDLSLGTRYDYVDRDAEVKGDHIHRLSAGVNLHLAPTTAIKLDYQQNWMHDRLMNLTRTAVIQFGIATYF